MPDSATASRPVPLAPAQQAALLPERLRDTPAGTLFVALELTGELDAVAFERAAAGVLAAHTVLRTNFPADRRVPYQRVGAVPDQVVETVPIGAEHLAGALRADAVHRFDLVDGIPVRIRRYVLADRSVLSIAVHPVAADDCALDLLIESLCVAYNTGTVAPARAQFRDFVPQQLKSLTTTPTADPSLSHWLARLDGLPERAELTAAAPGGESAPPSFRLDPETLADFAAGHDLAAAFAALLARSLGEAGLGTEVAVGVLDQARDADGAEDTIGHFANQLVLRLDSTAELSGRDQVAVAAEQVTAAREHGDTRIERLAHQLRGPGGALFQVLIGVRAAAQTARLRGVTVRELDRRLVQPHGVDLVVDVVGHPDGAVVTLQTSSDLRDRPEIAALAAHLDRRCRAWAVGADEPCAPTLFAAPEPGYDLFGLPGAGGPPQTDTERVVVEAIRQVLEFDADDEIGREDTFFSLGGDSIAALRLVTDLAEQGYTFDVQQVFGSPAIHELAALIDEAAAEPAATPAPAEVAPMSASGLDPAVLAALGKKFGQ
ncbi:condensation domain-containing protein [Nocardia sp. NPDC058176]|uniref:condensation domain-containing protein n=1 Tax=Nocardia sp. NPDC058176 TaxID=3346368 RepID=UPI0036DFA163